MQLNTHLDDQTSVDSENIEIEIEHENEAELNIQIGSEDFESELNGDGEKSSRFKDGEILSMIRVRFPGNAKSFPFFVGKRKFAYGQKVVAMSDRGMTVGYINSFPYDIEFNKSMLPIRSIAKVASEDDIRAQKDFRDSEKRAEVVCLRLIDRHRLDMILTHVEFIQFGKKAVFYFNAPERVDFRELVKDLVADLKMRIELRQISVRDRAAALGAVGACGLQTCCSSFLKAYGNVSIKMAKNQNLALIPSKLNGVCGQIKCCIKYEDDVYADKRKNLPREGSFIKAKNGDIGKVLKLHLLVEQFEMLTDFGAKRRYAAVEFIGENNLPENYRFPETFDHIVDETKEVIGLIKAEQIKADRFLEIHGNADDELDDSDNADEDAYYDDDSNDNEDENENVSVSAGATASENTPKPSQQHHHRDQHHNKDRDNNRTKQHHDRPQQHANHRNDQNRRPHNHNNNSNNNNQNQNQNRPQNARPNNNPNQNRGPRPDNRQNQNPDHKQNHQNRNKNYQRPRTNHPNQGPNNQGGNRPELNDKAKSENSNHPNNKK